MNEYLTFIFVTVLSSLVLSKEHAPLLTIPDGRIKGAIGSTGGQNKKFYSYRGIPFAKPPLGDLRFAAPKKNDPWNGTLDATKEKESCVQTNADISTGQPPTRILGSEDCLYVNVYTTNVKGSLPVMVWIYGGIFIKGQSTRDLYAPDNFLEKDVVYVSFNYRLGVFGFLSTEDESASGNWGIKDQVMALRWVKKNIQYFGGDPNQITIFGESAGGASVGYLLQTNMTNGLFHGAIMESGTSLCLWALARNARRKAFQMGSQLGINQTDSNSLIRDLRKVGYVDLKKAEVDVTFKILLHDNLLAGLPFGPVTEPDIPGAVFSGKSWQLLSTGQFQRVPLIVGYNSNETALVASIVGNNNKSLSETGFLRGIVESLPWFLTGWYLHYYQRYASELAPYDLTQNFFKKHRAGIDISNHYFGSNGVYKSPLYALIRYVNVDQFNRPIREVVHQASKFTKVYYYEFSYSGLSANPNQTYKGVAHAEELPYLFYSKDTAAHKSDFMTSQRMVTLWTNFAKTGNPTSTASKGDHKLLGGVTWEPNDPTTNSEASIKYLNINNSLTMESNPFQDDWTFYQGIYNKYGDPPYTTY